MMMKMVHHNHHHRPLTPFDNDSSVGGGGEGDGPTTSMSMSMTMPVTHNHHFINDVVSGGSASPAVVAAAAAIHSGGAAVRTLQPFDISTLPAFKSPGAMAASMGFPFTNAQWKELQRQAMIYKYMMASVPVPHHLLISTSSLTPASRSCLDSGFNLRLSSNSSDPEPGRCRRTDGKKWRCSRDVAPNHKYCERHMHRGRPRSRKPVEVQANSNNSNHQIKRARQEYQHPFPTSLVTVAVSNPTITNGGSSSQFFTSSATQPYHESSSLSLDKYGVKASNFDPLPSVPSDTQPRGFDWMLKGDPISMAASDPEWQPLMQNRVGLINQSSCNNNDSISSPNFEETLYLNSYASFNSGLNRRCPPFLNPLVIPMETPESQKPRGFIDAWSNAETGENNNNSANKSPVSSNAKLSLFSLDLSMGGGGGGSMVDEEMGTIQMGLGLMEPDDGNTQNGAKTHLSNWLTPAPWVGSTLGGPLAEVLRPSKVASANEVASDPSSPVVTNAESGSPLATMVSSPSGVLQKTLASMSDSSSNSSPTVASSRANSEIGLLWFNKAN